MINKPSNDGRKPQASLRDEHPRSPVREVTGARRRNRLQRTLSFIVGTALFVIAIYVLYRWSSNVTIDDLRNELADLPAHKVVIATVFAFASFIALAGYEHFAVRYIGSQLPVWKTGLYSFITQAIAHAVGFAIVVGPAIRYKLYSTDGLTLLDVAKIQVFFMTTFALGAVVLTGVVFLLEPDALIAATSIPGPVYRAIGFIALIGMAALLTWGALFHRPIRWFGRTIELPTARVTSIQILLGIADLCAVAAALHLLLPPELGLTYHETLGVFVAAMSIGLLSHVPGSLGVFEGAVILLVSPYEPASADLLGALIAFRAIYYILPLICGALAFAALQITRASLRTRSA